MEDFIHVGNKIENNFDKASLENISAAICAIMRAGGGDAVVKAGLKAFTKIASLQVAVEGTSIQNYVFNGGSDEG